MATLLGMVMIAGGIAILAVVKPWRRDDDDYDDEPDDTPTAVISMKPIKRPSPKVKAGPRPGRPQPSTKSTPRPDSPDDLSPAPRAKSKPSSTARTRPTSGAPYDSPGSGLPAGGSLGSGNGHGSGAAERMFTNGHDYGDDSGFGPSANGRSLGSGLAAGGSLGSGNGHGPGNTSATGSGSVSGAERMFSNGRDYGDDSGFGPSANGRTSSGGHGSGAERVVSNGHDYGADLGFGNGYGPGNSQGRRHRIETISRARRVPPAPGREEITLPDWLGPVSGPR